VNAIAACTVTSKSDVAVCPVVSSVTVTLYDAEAAVPDGVPDNTPDDASTLKPAGNGGDTANVLTPKPPVTTGICDTIATSVTNSTDEYPVENTNSARGVTDDDASDGSPLPSLLIAETRKRYAVPFVKSAIT
jgi:hypothetical protein